MKSPFVITRLAVFTISLLLLLGKIDPGWGIDGGWGWYLAIVLLASFTFVDLMCLVTMILAFLVLVGLIDDGKPVLIAMTIFSGAALVRRIASRNHPGQYVSWHVSSHRFGRPPPAD